MVTRKQVVTLVATVTMSLEDQIKKDYNENRLTYRQLCSKYRKSARDIAKVLKGSEVQRSYSIEPRFSISERGKNIIYVLALEWNVSTDQVVERLYGEWREMRDKLPKIDKIEKKVDIMFKLLNATYLCEECGRKAHINLVMGCEHYGENGVIMPYKALKHV